MSLLPKILVGLVAAEHVYILWIEMFAWTTKGRATFRGFPAELFEPTKTLAANQGLYNGFLAAGLVWSLLIQDTEWSRNVALFFLGCVITAGLYGWMTVSRSIFIKQGLPAVLAMLAVLFA